MSREQPATNGDQPDAKLYVILGSHACRTGMLLLEHKGIPYRTKMLPTGGQHLLHVMGFGGGTVPALVIDGRRIQTNIAIARVLDELQPEPPLLPSDPARRAAVEEAERWSDEPFQMLARRLALAGSVRGPDGVVNGGRDGRLGPLLWRHDRTRRIGTKMISRFIFDVNPETERELLAELPAALDRVDAWLEAGVIGGEQLYAADYAIASNLAMLTYRPDLRDQIAQRPSGAFVDRILPEPASYN